MKGINNHAPVKCSKRITINANNEKVWQVLTNISGWTTWNTQISKVTFNGKLKPEINFNWKTGGVKIHSTLHTVDPFNHFGWTGKAF